MVDTFQERQKELCFLSSFIEEHEKWLDGLLCQLGWTRDRLSGKGSSLLTVCPFNPNHYVPKESLEKHKLKCCYAAQGIHIGQQEIEELLLPIEDCEFYKNTNSKQKSLDISPEELQAICTLAREEEHPQLTQAMSKEGNVERGGASRELIDPSEVIVESHDSLVTKEHFSSLEGVAATPQEILLGEPLLLIRYIMSWQLIPVDYASLALSDLQPAMLKAWLFNSLPKQHLYSSELGGEMKTVDAIVRLLLTPMGGRETVSPNAVMQHVRPLLGFNTRAFVLSLWKHLHITGVQRTHGIPDRALEDLAPLPLPLPLPPIPTSLDPIHKQEKSLVERVKEKLVDNKGADHPSPTGTPTPAFAPALPIPADHMRFKLTPQERALLHKYASEVIRSQVKTKEDALLSDLGHLNNNGSEGSHGEEGREASERSYLEVLKEERDYKRRRQSYRAKNVHITRRTPAQVMKAIIDARMKEIGDALGGKEEGEEEGEGEGGSEEEGKAIEKDRYEGRRRNDSARWERRERYDYRRQEDGGRDRHQWRHHRDRTGNRSSRSRSHSRSREDRMHGHSTKHQQHHLSASVRSHSRTRDCSPRHRSDSRTCDRSPRHRSDSRTRDRSPRHRSDSRTHDRSPRHRSHSRTHEHDADSSSKSHSKTRERSSKSELENPSPSIKSSSSRPRAKESCSPSPMASHSKGNSSERKKYHKHKHKHKHGH